MSIPFKHILICRTDNIGDLVLTLPLAGYLKREYPGVQVDFLCRAYALPVVRHCRFVDQVFALEDISALPGQQVGNVRGAMVSFFARNGFDTVIFAYPQRRLALAARAARIPNRVGTSHRWFHWLTCNRLAHFSRVNSPLHEAQLNFALLKPLGLNFLPALAAVPELYGLDVPGSSSDRSVIDSAMEDGIHALLAEKPFNLILHPKSNGNGREWPIGHFAKLARLLLPDSRIGLLVTGSGAEGGWLERYGTELLAVPNVRNVCGKFDLNGLLALIARSDGLIASGTGPLHLAAALGTPTLGLFPPVKPIDPARWGPLGWQAQVMCQTQGCAHCKDIMACTCMQNITPELVAQVVKEWIAARMP